MTTTLTDKDKVVQEYDPSPGTPQLSKPTRNTDFKVGKLPLRTPCLYTLKSSIFAPSSRRAEYAASYGLFGLLPAERSDVKAFKLALTVGWEDFIMRPELASARNGKELPPLFDRCIIPYSKDIDEQTNKRNKDNPHVLAFSANTAGYKGDVQLPGPRVVDSTGKVVKLQGELPLGSEVIVAVTAVYKVCENSFDQQLFGRVSFYLNSVMIYKMGEQQEEQTATLPVALEGGWAGNPEEEEEAPAEKENPVSRLAAGPYAPDHFDDAPF